MSEAQSQGQFRLLLINNLSTFDATVRFFGRYVAEGSAAPREFLLGSVSSGDWRVFEASEIPNGEEVTLQAKSAGNYWTPSNIYITYTSSSLRKIRYLIKGTKQSPELIFDGVVEDAIKTPLPPLPDHRRDSEKVTHKPIPEPSSELKDKFRWMQCVVQNKTQFMIVHNPPAYFDSGRYEDAPTNIEPYDNMIFTVCNGDNTIATGATGGTAFRIILDGVAEYPFALGWTTPFIGPYTAGVAASTNAEDGYKSATNAGNSIKSKEEFSGMDEHGKESKFRFEISASPGRRAMYVINQLRVV